jgi:hypothetical protein
MAKTTLYICFCDIVSMLINADKCPLLQAHNPKVLGSNPSPATKKFKGLSHFGLNPFFVGSMPVLCWAQTAVIEN